MGTQGFRVSVGTNLEQLLRNIDDFEKQHVPFVTAGALTRTAKDIQAAEYRKMAEVFDRPTRFTLNSLRVKPATKKSLTAAVLFKDGFGSVPAYRYLGPAVEGGARVKKSHERALERAGILQPNEFTIPASGAELDEHGNMRGRDFTRILSQLQASPDPQQNMSRRSRKGAIRRAGGRYFVMRKGNVEIPDGIYIRRGLREIQPVLLFVAEPLYDKRYPFRGTAAETFRRSFNRHFRALWREHVRKPGRADIPF